MLQRRAVALMATVCKYLVHSNLESSTRLKYRTAETHGSEACGPEEGGWGVDKFGK